jgi:hypothetical protein
MSALRSITPETIKNAFDASGPFFEGENAVADGIANDTLAAVEATLEEESSEWVDDVNVNSGEEAVI